MPHLQGMKGWGVRMKPRAKSLILANKHASQSWGGRRGLDLGKQKCWIVVCSVCSSLEAVWPVTNAGSSLAWWEQGARTALWAEVP